MACLLDNDSKSATAMKLERLLQNKPFAIATFISISFIVIYFILWHLTILHSLESRDTIGTISGWCERVSGGPFREPANALSNLGFMFAGLLMIRALSRDPGRSRCMNQFHGLTPMSILYAGSVIFLGAGSMLMHGTQSSWGGWADDLSMVIYILIPWLINVGEMGQWTARKFFVTYTIIVSIYACSRWFFGNDLGLNLNIFEVSIGLWVISEVLFRFWSQRLKWFSGFVGFGVAAVFGIMPTEIFSNIGEYWWVILFWLPAAVSSSRPEKRRIYHWYLVGIFSFLTAFVIWLQGYPDTVYCNPDSLIQPHAIWHLMTAFTTWCFFKFLRTEKKVGMVV